MCVCVCVYLCDLYVCICMYEVCGMFGFTRPKEPEKMRPNSFASNVMQIIMRVMNAFIHETNDAMAWCMCMHEYGMLH